MSIGAGRRLEDLSAHELEQLRQVHARLRDAVAKAERINERALATGMEVPYRPLKDLARAREAVDEAEEELWRVREKLLGWIRPASALPAREVLDWFSAEDEIYDSET